MRLLVGSSASRISSKPVTTAIVITALLLIPLLILAHGHPTPGVVDAVPYLDGGVLTFLNVVAQYSPGLAVLARELSNNAVSLQAVLVALFWAAWFSKREPSSAWQRRSTMLASLVGLFATVVIAIALRAALPFRPRPFLNSEIASQFPYLPFDSTLPVNAHSTSLPAGHAAVFFALATVLWSVSIGLGLGAFLHASLAICLPRIYSGLHYPTDILFAAILAIVTVTAANELLGRSALIHRLLGWSETHPAVFYATFFAFSVEVALEFSSIRPFLKLLENSYFNKIVMLGMGVATS